MARAKAMIGGTKNMENSRDQWLQVLEKIATTRPDHADAEWAWLMKQLDLGPEYFLAIYEAVRQGRWRRAENPAGYLKAAAKREARWIDDSGERRVTGLPGIQGLEPSGEEIPLGRGGSMDVDGETFSGEEMLDHLQYRQESGKPIRAADAVWRTAAGREADPEGLLRPRALKGKLPTKEEMKHPSPLSRNLERLKRKYAAAGKPWPEEAFINDAPEKLPDWNTWAEQAGLSDWEKKVVEYKMSRVGWTEAMRAQPDEASRRALQAAWRRLERNGRERLERALPEEIGGSGDREIG